MIRTKVFTSAFIISFAFMMIGLTFKILHWQGSGIFILLSLAATLLYTIVALYEVHSADNIRGIEKIIWTVGFISFFPLSGLLYYFIRRPQVLNRPATRG